MSVGKRNDLTRNGELDIPHNRVTLKAGVLSKEDAERDYLRQITHELRTPLNAIIGLCQCLERDREAPLNEQQRDTVERMERNAHALLESINKLLEHLRGGGH